MSGELTPRQQRENKIAADLHYSLRRQYVDAFFAQQVAKVPPKSLVCDLGGHKSAKRGKFDIREYDLRVITINLSVGRRPDIQADAGQVPHPANTYDVVICGELLEHVPNPVQVLHEAYRVLRPEGVLLISVPFMFPMHEQPYDFGRYTNFFWDDNLRAAGFRQIEIQAQGSYWSVLAEMVRAQAYDRASRQRPHHLTLRRMMAGAVLRFKRWALNKDAQPSYASDPFYSKYTTGFGIRCMK